MGIEITRLLRTRRRWRWVLLLSMLAMAVCLALLATVWRGDAGLPGRLTIGALFLSTSVACFAWWRHLRALLSIKQMQQRPASSEERSHHAS